MTHLELHARINCQSIFPNLQFNPLNCNFYILLLSISLLTPLSYNPIGANRHTQVTINHS